MQFLPQPQALQPAVFPMLCLLLWLWSEHDARQGSEWETCGWWLGFAWGEGPHLDCCWWGLTSLQALRCQAVLQPRKEATRHMTRFTWSDKKARMTHRFKGECLGVYRICNLQQQITATVTQRSEHVNFEHVCEIVTWQWSCAHVKRCPNYHLLSPSPTESLGADCLSFSMTLTLRWELSLFLEAILPAHRQRRDMTCCSLLQREKRLNWFLSANPIPWKLGRSARMSSCGCLWWGHAIGCGAWSVAHGC